MEERCELEEATFINYIRNKTTKIVTEMVSRKTEIGLFPTPRSTLYFVPKRDFWLDQNNFLSEPASGRKEERKVDTEANAVITSSFDKK